MFRIKDPKASLKFYTEILGMELVRKADGGDFVSTGFLYCDRMMSVRSRLKSIRNLDLVVIPRWSFLSLHSVRSHKTRPRRDAKQTPQTNYFLAFPSPELASLSAGEKEARATSIPGVLELCHNWGTEDPSQNFEGYTNGNEEGKKGFGHIAVSVDDVQKSCDRFTELGVEFKKRPEEGKMRNIAL